MNKIDKAKEVLKELKDTRKPSLELDIKIWCLLTDRIYLGEFHAPVNGGATTFYHSRYLINYPDKKGKNYVVGQYELKPRNVRIYDSGLISGDDHIPNYTNCLDDAAELAKNIGMETILPNALKTVRLALEMYIEILEKGKCNE